MPISTYQKKNIEVSKRKAFEMYKMGMTLREIGKIVGRSHTWVWAAVIQLEKAQQKKA